VRAVGLARVTGRSMEPTLREGDLLLVLYGARPRLGSIVVARLPDRPVAVKRLTMRVDEGWWLERDNPTEGVDSWEVGAVADVDVLGRAMVRLWPPGLLRGPRTLG
jgi:phage repressor protein C with HTH and peptisase S24 domain